MKKIAILVSTFDKYSVCWDPFIHGLSKYWPDHPEDVYFITNYKQPPAGIAIPVGSDQGWSMNLMIALEKIQSPYVVYCQEDYWITHPVNNQNIIDYIYLLESDLVDYIRLYPAPGPDSTFLPDYRLGNIADHAEYRASLQMAIWRKTVLQEMLVPQESPWGFEVRGSKYSQKFHKRFACVKKADWGIRYLFTAVVDGEWSTGAYNYAKNENIEIDFSQLPQKSQITRYKTWIKRLLYRHYRPIQKTIRRFCKP